jgi:putative phosphoesterase
MARSIIVGVISDTHGLVRPEALAALRGVDRILHAGDVCGRHVIDALAAIAPVTVVRGNNDYDAWGRTLPETEAIEIGGLSFYMLHDLHDLDLEPAAAGFAAVIAGHSHKPRNEVSSDGVLWFNPGSAGPRRFTLPVTVGKLTIDPEGGVRGEIVRLLDP